MNFLSKNASLEEFEEFCVKQTKIERGELIIQEEKNHLKKVPINDELYQKIVDTRKANPNINWRDLFRSIPNGYLTVHAFRGAFDNYAYRKRRRNVPIENHFMDRLTPSYCRPTQIMETV